MQSEVAARVDFSQIRYAQCWEDADVLLEALNVRPGDVCLSIASAGDNTLALLARNPARVVAVDLNLAQLACLELRVAAYRRLEHPTLLELLGARPSDRRSELYRACRGDLSIATRDFWDAQPDAIAQGIAGAGKFERYFALFRRRILPLIHSQARVAALLAPKPEHERIQFYQRHWDTWRWQLLFRLFFSKYVLGRAGRDPSFFRYVEGKVSARILQRSEYALTRLDPATNPYLRWILSGRYETALPFALREENFAIIRANLDRLEWRHTSLERYLGTLRPGVVNQFNLSDIFEYMSEPAYHGLLKEIVRVAVPGARLAYWNTLVQRRRPEQMASALRPLESLGRRLHLADKAFFYCAFVLEEVAG